MSTCRVAILLFAAASIGVFAAADGQECAPPPFLSPLEQICQDSTGVHVNDLGSWDSCTAPDSGANYCLLRTGNVTFGLCVPQACGPQEILNATTGVMSYLFSQIPILIFLDPFDADITCGSHALPIREAGVGAKVTIGLTSFLLVLVLVGTAIDFCERRKGKHHGGSSGGDGLGSEPCCWFFFNPLLCCKRSKGCGACCYQWRRIWWGDDLEGAGSANSSATAAAGMRSALGVTEADGADKDDSLMLKESDSDIEDDLLIIAAAKMQQRQRQESSSQPLTVLGVPAQGIATVANSARDAMASGGTADGDRSFYEPTPPLPPPVSSHQRSAAASYQHHHHHHQHHQYLFPPASFGATVASSPGLALVATSTMMAASSISNIESAAAMLALSGGGAGGGSGDQTSPALGALATSPFTGIGRAVSASSALPPLSPRLAAAAAGKAQSRQSRSSSVGVKGAAAAAAAVTMTPPRKATEGTTGGTGSSTDASPFLGPAAAEPAPSGFFDDEHTPRQRSSTADHSAPSSPLRRHSQPPSSGLKPTSSSSSLLPPAASTTATAASVRYGGGGGSGRRSVSFIPSSTDGLGSSPATALALLSSGSKAVTSPPPQPPGHLMSDLAAASSASGFLLDSARLGAAIARKERKSLTRERRKSLKDIAALVGGGATRSTAAAAAMAAAEAKRGGSAGSGGTSSTTAAAAVSQRRSIGCRSPCGFFTNLLLCFSLYETFPRLFPSASSSFVIGVDEAWRAAKLQHHPSLRIFDAIRVLAVVTVIAGHSFLYLLPLGLTNLAAIVPPDGLAATSIAFQALTHADFAVDSFLFVGGFLAVYSLLVLAARLAASDRAKALLAAAAAASASQENTAGSRSSRRSVAGSAVGFFGAAAALGGSDDIGSPMLLDGGDAPRSPTRKSIASVLPAAGGSINSGAAGSLPPSSSVPPAAARGHTQARARGCLCCSRRLASCCRPLTSCWSVLVLGEPSEWLHPLLRLPVLLSFVLHRLVRILPSFGFVVLAAATLAPSLSSGPWFFLMQPFTEGCRQYWWTQVTFVSNLIPWGLASAPPAADSSSSSSSSSLFDPANSGLPPLPADSNAAQQCLSGGLFYFPLDFQLLLLLPVGITASYLLLPRAGLALATVLLLASMLAAFVVVTKNGISAIITLDQQQQQANPLVHLLPGSALFVDLFLSKLWTRAPAYLVGIITCLIWDTALRVRQQWALRRRQASLLGASSSDEAAPPSAAKERAVARAWASVLQRFRPPQQQEGQGSTDGALPLLSSPSANRAVGRRRRLPPFSLSLPAQLMIQSLGVAVMAACVYGGISLYQDPMASASPYSDAFRQWASTSPASVAFTAASRAAWSVGLCLLVLPVLLSSTTQPSDKAEDNAAAAAVETNPLLSLLGSRLWAPFARLTLGAYLANSLVIATVTWSSVNLPRFSHVEFVASVAGNTALSFAIALLLYLGIERPCANMELAAASACSSARARSKGRRQDTESGICSKGLRLLSALCSAACSCSCTGCRGSGSNNANTSGRAPKAPSRGASGMGTNGNGDEPFYPYYRLDG